MTAFTLSCTFVFNADTLTSVTWNQKREINNMLQNFKVLQIRHPNGVPMCIALLSIEASPQPFPYAWVDTIKSPDTLTVTVIDQGRQFDRKKVADTLTALTGQEASPDALRDHMIELAEKKLATRQNYFDKQKRKYAKTIYAAQDAAFACYPAYGTKRLQKSLENARAEVTDNIAIQDDGLSLLGFSESKQWTWNDYDEPWEAVDSLLHRLHAIKMPIPITVGEKQMPLSTGVYAALVDHKKEARTDKRRFRTPKSRLQFLVEQARATRYVEMDSSYMRDVPCPLAAYKAEQLAQLPKADFLQLLLETEDWIAMGFLMHHRCTYAKDPTKDPDGKDVLESLKVCCTHKLEGDRVVWDRPLTTTLIGRMHVCARVIKEHNIRFISEKFQNYIDNQYDKVQAMLEAAQAAQDEVEEEDEFPDLERELAEIDVPEDNDENG